MTVPKTAVLVCTRIAFGFLFLNAGIEKLFSDFSATTYLQNATSGPFSSYFQSLAGNNLVDFLVIFGEIGIGLALIFGVLLTVASLCGVLMMILFYISSFPPTSGIININIMYGFIFLILISHPDSQKFSAQPILQKLVSQIPKYTVPKTHDPNPKTDHVPRSDYK
ncbi:MAG: DoxX family protein [Microgenomates group bacterium]